MYIDLTKYWMAWTKQNSPTYMPFLNLIIGSVPDLAPV